MGPEKLPRRFRATASDMRYTARICDVAFAATLMLKHQEGEGLVASSSFHVECCNKPQDLQSPKYDVEAEFAGNGLLIITVRVACQNQNGPTASRHVDNGRVLQHLAHSLNVAQLATAREVRLLLLELPRIRKGKRQELVCGASLLYRDFGI